MPAPGRGRTPSSRCLAGRRLQHSPALPPQAASGNASSLSHSPREVAPLALQVRDEVAYRIDVFDAAASRAALCIPVSASFFPTHLGPSIEPVAPERDEHHCVVLRSPRKRHERDFPIFVEF
jgi:hypothetical protein